MKTIIALVLAALTLGACKGSPFNPHAEGYRNPCHPNIWYGEPQQVDSATMRSQAYCDSLLRGTP